MTNFVNLHNHTTFSLLDGLCKVDDLVKATVDAGMKSVAITDHGNLFGVIDFYKSAQKSGIKPIVGMEAYVSKTPIDSGKKMGIKNSYNHLILLAKNMTGYNNLVKLSSIAYQRGFYYKPRVDDNLLEQYSEGLIATSACLKGAVPELLLNNKDDEAEDKVRQYLDIFDGEFYIELQDHGIDEELIVKEKLINLARQMDVKLIVTNDGHYVKKEHAVVHDLMMCMQTKTTVSDPNRWKMSTQELYYKTRTDLETLFPNIPDAFDNTVEIANKCNVLFDFSGYNIPNAELPEKDREAGPDKYLEKLCFEGLERKVAKITPQYIDRMNMELSTITKMRFSDYFLVTQDFINYARNNGIPVGPGRGSAAGSLVSFSLGITNIDPLKYDLLFERFLNPDRISMPDIDIDFCIEGRDQVIQYVRDKYGSDCVAQIITFGTMKAKGAVRDMGRVMDMPYDDVAKITKLIPDTVGISLKDSIAGSPELTNLINADPKVKELFDHAKIVEGMERHTSVHAAGVVIAPKPLTEYLPLYRDAKTEKITTQFTMGHIEDMGLLKMDFLGLRNLTVIKECVTLLAETGIVIDIDNIPLDDAKTYELFGRGDTRGVFQFESSGMQDYLRKLKPESIDDLCAMNALYRPGPLGNNMVDDFIHRKHGKADFEYIHPLTEPVLKDTYGVIIYQEQVMRLASVVGGFTLPQADILRKAMGKKNENLMQEMKAKFVSGCVKNKMPEKTAIKLWDHIDKFAGYGFNKSHSAAYAMIAYQTAFLKANYTAEFMAANLTSEMDNTDRIVFLLEECKNMGMEILPPDVRNSRVKFCVQEGKIRFGLGAIKNVGSAAMTKLVENREVFKNCTNFYEFCEKNDGRVINKKVLESLIKAGALDTLEGNRQEKFNAIEVALNISQQATKEREKGQTNMFAGGAESDSDEPIEEFMKLPEHEEWSNSELLNREKESIGFFVSGHPLDNFKDEVLHLSTNTFEELSNLNKESDEKPVKNGGIITSVKVIQTKKNTSMAFVTMEDYSGSIELIFFTDQYLKYKHLIETDQLVFVTGNLSLREDDKPKIKVAELIHLEAAREAYVKYILLDISSSGLEKPTLDEIMEILKKHNGSSEVVFNIKTRQKECVMVKSAKYQVKVNDEILSELRSVLGQSNVRIVGSDIRKVLGLTSMTASS